MSQRKIRWGLPIAEALAVVDRVMAEYPNPRWGEDPEWLKAKLREAACDNGLVSHNEALDLLVGASNRKMIGGANAGMARIKDGWRTTKVLLPSPRGAADIGA